MFFKHGERFRDLVGSPYYVAPEVRQGLSSSWAGQGDRKAGLGRAKGGEK